jgi:cytochrome c-type biogenesis protein CcmH/NrfG
MVFHRFIGKAAFHLKEFSQAEAAYTRASDLNGSNIKAWQGLAEIFTETGSWVSLDWHG